MSRISRAARFALTSLEWLAVGAVVVSLLGGVAIFVVLWWPYDSPARVGESRAQPFATVTSGAASASTPAPAATTLFTPIFAVLQSPRCMNCHPAGDRPLWGNGEVHAMNLSRTSVNAGLVCEACHQQTNADAAVGIHGGPPGAPHWQLPPADMPMVFQGMSESALCQQLRDPARNGGKTLSALLHHVREDPLVLWAWKPGGSRTTPPLSHSVFVAAFKKWVDAEGRCVGD